MRVPPRRILAGLAFAAIVLSGLDTRFVRLLARNREDLRAELAIQSPDIRNPGFIEFLDEVQRRTARGQSIALVVRMRHWDEGYAYAYYRASYILAGRRVIPLVDSRDALHRERFAEADLVAVWGMPPPNGPFALLWTAHGGGLYRRMR